MSLEPGTRLGPYEITAPIGAGGMGEVYRATDTKLKRDVAIKVLPDDFARDRERLARFEREARLLAALNHPNVASIYGLDAEGEVHFLVLELVDGLTLARMTKTGPLPVEETLDICRQVSEGLEAAHEAGVIHRDLKPGNVIVTEDGKAKVLDFGLAKGLEEASSGDSGSDLSMSPTITVAGTQAGVVLGTAPYMSPEQARGKKLDKRTDIWSFGCLLYECLAGRLAYPGETVTDTLSAVLQNEPDWSALPDRTPRRIRDLLERCLEKSPRNRLHDIGDARIDLEKALAGREWTTSAIGALPDLRMRPRAAWRRALILAVGAILAAAAGGSFALWSSRRAPVPITRISMVAEPSLDLLAAVKVSPDGRSVAYRGRVDPEASDTFQLYIRSLDSFESRPLRGTEGAKQNIAYSPDGEWIAFIARGPRDSQKRNLYKVPVDGSSLPVALTEVPPNVEIALWHPDGVIYAIQGGSFSPELHRFPADGGGALAPMAVKAPGIRQNLTWPTSILPDGHLLAVAGVYTDKGWESRVEVIDPETGEARLLIQGGFPAWSPTGHLLFSRGDTLLAVGFDPERMETIGSPVALEAGLREHPVSLDGIFDLSAGGTLVYTGGSTGERRLVIVDTDGRSEPWLEKKGYYFDVSPSPDGEHVAVMVGNMSELLYEIWLSDFDKPRLQPLVDYPGMDCISPLWDPRSLMLAYSCFGDEDPGGIYLARIADPSEPRLLLERGEGGFILPTAFAPDGSVLLVTKQVAGIGKILAVPLEAGAHGYEIEAGQAGIENPDFSPDGEFIAYHSNASGRYEIYVRSIDAEGRLGTPSMISTDGGTSARWSVTEPGEPFELTYQSGDKIVAVSIATEPMLTSSDPRTLVNPREHRALNAARLPDGRFLIIQKSLEEDQPRQINLVLGIFEDLKRRVPLD